MEAALTPSLSKRPPPILEKMVVWLLPPAVRESVAGDLWERYRAPEQYMADALTTLPFVVVSQMRRNVNLPVTGLQSLLVFFCLGGGSVALPLTAGFALFLLLAAAYQGIGPPPVARAALETVLIALGMTVMLVAVTRSLATLGWMPGLQLGIIGPLLTRLQLGAIVPFLLPVLCIFRARLIADWEGEEGFDRAELHAEDMARLFRRDALRATRRNRMESAAFGTAALACALLLRPFFPAHAVLSMCGLYLCATAWLLLSSPAEALPAKAGLMAIRALYQDELARQDRLRRLMWWLWLTPALYAIHLCLIGAETRLTAWGISLAALLCFVVSSINRERGGRVRETIALLSRMRDAKTT